jgi:hypothetical protein
MSGNGLFAWSGSPWFHEMRADSPAAQAMTRTVFVLDGSNPGLLGKRKACLCGTTTLPACRPHADARDGTAS